MPHCGWVAYQTGGCWPHGLPTTQYNELSGFPSIALPPLLTLAGVAVLWWWHHRCHQHRCARPGRFPAAGGRFVTCRHHHPDPAVREGLRAHHIHAAHQRWLSGGSPP